ncbi:hypothetical protein AB0K15_17690 [Amycolatopsis sp. NPDC049253]|uniref:hypothetical protein n=1 Tax=Amycolatopsis sp. NPDC049253 TaxID=3155274 RepID=UPI003416C92A
MSIFDLAGSNPGAIQERLIPDVAQAIRETLPTDLRFEIFAHAQAAAIIGGAMAWLSTEPQVEQRLVVELIAETLSTGIRTASTIS